jgi:large subunit ribosomal protein L35
VPKMKTRKSAAKRVSRTGTGKFLLRHSGRSHLLTRKSEVRKRRLAKPTLAAKGETRRLKRMLPYG